MSVYQVLHRLDSGDIVKIKINLILNYSYVWVSFLYISEDFNPTAHHNHFYKNMIQESVSGYLNSNEITLKSAAFTS